MTQIREISGIKDLYKSQQAREWQIDDARELQSTVIETDVVIIGTGAGGGTTAEIFAKQGLKVLMLEEGPLKSSDDFVMQESVAYHDLYQEQAGRVTKDGGMSILQGRCVGGTTVINWTSSFRTPSETLQYWAEEFGVKGVSPTEMEPWFEKMEKRLNVATWRGKENDNNAVLRDGCEAVSIDWKKIPRNVSGCWNLGYCGMGCPTNAKQSMLVTTIPKALEHGARLIHSISAHSLMMDKDRVIGVKCLVPSMQTIKPPKKAVKQISTITIKASKIIMACGAINGPALLLRSKIPDPHQLIGKRTFLHPTVFSFAQFEKRIDPFFGAPQSVYSDHYQWKGGVSGPVGFKLEVPPLHPGFASILLMGHGQRHAQDMSKLAHTHSMIALLRDGFNKESIGGKVQLDDDGSPIVDYPINDYLWQGVKRAHLSMAKLQFAAGAKKVRAAHTHGEWFTSYQAYADSFNSIKYENHSVLVGSAHVMGGLPMGEDRAKSLVNSDGKYHHLKNLWVFDGSIFPTSIGANPQLSIYGLICKLATQLAKSIKPTN